MPDAEIRCTHGRLRLDPCWGCGRRYAYGELLGPFLVSRETEARR